METKEKKITRGSGILMHLTSLPGEYGIGTMGKEAYDFIDFLEKAGQKYWQILPVGPTGYGDSPYQALSSFAGNPYLIALDDLIEKDLLKEIKFKRFHFGWHEKEVDFRKISKNKMKMLRSAYERFKKRKNNHYEYERFKIENKAWIEDYALYMALKSKFKGKPWFEWEHRLIHRQEDVLYRYKKWLKDEMCFWTFLQYQFFRQWRNLKRYANSKGIKIIGDLPIYTAYDSVDTWTNSHLFALDRNKIPKLVSGCPPDAFSREGQLWGNPVYDWKENKKSGYEWWIRRIEANKKLFDVIRLDHFRGFESFWAVPYGEKTAVNGRWLKGPGIKFFNTIKKSLGEINMIAEDLGFITPEVKKLLEETGYPGMKVLLFAFDSKQENEYLPHKYRENCAAYTGTHDNDTVIGWMNDADDEKLQYAKRYLNLNRREGYHWGFVRGVWSSAAFIAIAQMQDFIGLGSESRMNTPSTFGESNWKWRATKKQITNELAKKIYEISGLYERL